MMEIGYLDLLEKIANNEIITTNLVIKDDVGRHWKYQNNIKSFVSGMHQDIYEEPYMNLSECYTNLELYNLVVTVLPREVKIPSEEETYSFKEIFKEIIKDDSFDRKLEVMDDEDCSWFYDNVEGNFVDVEGNTITETYEDRDLASKQFRIIKNTKSVQDIADEIEQMTHMLLNRPWTGIDTDTRDTILDAIQKLQIISKELKESQD